MWTLSYLHIMPFSAISIGMIVIGFAVGIFASKKARNSLAAVLQKPKVSG